MSRAKLSLSMAERDDIVRTSIRNNSAASITGLLLCDGLRFLQALEGDAANVDQCWDRIRQDDRHFDMVVFENALVKRREFGDWALSCHSQLLIDPHEFRGRVMNDVASVTNPKLKAMFVGFASLAR